MYMKSSLCSSKINCICIFTEQCCQLQGIIESILNLAICSNGNGAERIYSDEIKINDKYVLEFNNPAQNNGAYYPGTNAFSCIGLYAHT